MYYVYVIYSQIKQGYYVGQTEDVAARILRHNNGYESYTSKYMPWELAISIHKETRSEAVQLERKLKNLTKKRLDQFISKYATKHEGPDNSD